MKKYTIGRGNEKTQPNKSENPKKSSKSSKSLKKEIKEKRKKYIQREQQIVQKVMRENEGNPTMGFKNYTELTKYMKSNHDAHERDGFYTNTILGKEYLLAPAEGQNRPTILVDGKVVYHPKSRASIHRHFLEESARRDAMKDVFSKKSHDLTGTSMEIPHATNSIIEFAAKNNINVPKIYLTGKDVSTKSITVQPDPGSRRGGKKNKKNKTRRK
jgi:hypothetical protein